MPHKGRQLTLTVFLCSLFVNKVNKTSFFGGLYLSLIDYFLVASELYMIGAILGRARRSKLNILAELLFVPGTAGHDIKGNMTLSEEGANKRLERFRSRNGREPGTFNEFCFFSGVEGALEAAGIDLSPQDAFENYVNGDKGLRKLFDATTKLERVELQIKLLLSEGICFGALFPELTERMCRKTKIGDIWAGTRLEGFDIAETGNITSLEDAEKVVLEWLTAYVAKYYPERIDALGLGNAVQSYEATEYEILNELLLTEGANLIRRSIKHPELLGKSTLSVSTNPFHPSDSEYLTRAFLGGPSHIGHFDPERLETILKKLLQDDYERYYQTARQNIVSRHTRSPSGKGNNQAD